MINGRLTLPSEENFLEETKELMERWGADAIRDSDGTKLDEQVKSLPAKIYTTYFVARAHNDFAEQHPEETQQLYLLSNRITAVDTQVVIPFMEGFLSEQIAPDYYHNPKEWWEVMDRTTGEVVAADLWEVDAESHSVTFAQAKPFHEYTVSFLAYMIWDPTQMYNHITNDWGDKPHDIPFDVRQPYSNKFVKEYLKQWLVDHPDTDVVRFTTFFYHFTLFFNDERKEKFVDWFGYGGTVSVQALNDFEQAKGYRLRPEDFVDEGYYNSTFRNPSRAYLDYIDFIQAFVAKEAKALVDLVHESGKEAIMFLGDNWIGTEPYGKYFEEIGMDAVVGSVGGGATLRMIADIPHVKYTEGRFLPYFFPDTFYEGNDPNIEANENWLTARRAIMRRPVDRIGYGGYLSLAYKFPKFVDYITTVADEFREIHDTIKDVEPYTAVKVVVLNAWGTLRSWQSHMVAHALHYKQIYSYQGILEALSGMQVDVRFMSFDEVLANGVPTDTDVIINAGDAGTAFSGGDYWQNERLVTLLSEWVYKGGGLIGVGEPSAYLQNGRFFQLANIFGVDKELGFTLSTDKYFKTVSEAHFITEQCTSFDFGESMKNVYALNKNTEILEYSNDEIHLSSHDFGKGRGVYLAGLPYSEENARLLYRAIYYAANKEKEYDRWNMSNPFCEVHYYPAIGKVALVNNSMKPQATTFYDGEGQAEEVNMAASEIIWRDVVHG